jgi:hypothetical protein
VITHLFRVTQRQQNTTINTRYFSALWPGVTKEKSASKPEPRSQVCSATSRRPFHLSLVCGLKRLFILYLLFIGIIWTLLFASNKFAPLSKDKHWTEIIINTRNNSLMLPWWPIACFQFLIVTWGYEIISIVCSSLYRLIRRPEHLIGRHCGIFRQTEGHSFGDHLISESVLSHRVL